MNDEQARRVSVERIDFASVLPVLHLFRSFRMAIQPAKLALALLLVLGLYGSAWLVDTVVGRPVEPGAFAVHQQVPTDPAFYRQWIESDPQRSLGVFEATAGVAGQAMRQLVGSAVSLELGLGRAIETRSFAGGGVVGALGTLLVTLPGWLIMHHPFALVAFGVLALLLGALLGGAIARLAAVGAAAADAHAAGEPGGLVAAVRFTLRRYAWFFLAPLLPLLIVALIAVLLAVGGLVLFNLPGLDIVGGVIFGLLLAGGLVAAVVLLGLAAAGHLLWPGLAVEGTDAFDVISRAYNYVFGRPWRAAGYALVSVIYGSVAWAFVALVITLGLVLTGLFTGAWVMRDAAEGLSRFEAMFSPAGLMSPAAPARFDALGPVGSIAAALVQGWTFLVAALAPAFAVSFYFCAATWAYLLLRQASDGTSFQDIDGDTAPRVDEDEAEPAQR